ncbi:tyrosine-type recombinase/integrase [Falsihalocynthiibacter sp. CO-5D18]|uniref:tyrosine-type recombinase/integrase n=1 Tax=Falsihalocynthiibacter sp. CO-5D18 TaxID=3240872 RepID=UPI00350F84CD
MTTGGIRKPEKALTVQFVKSVTTAGKYFDGNGLFLRVKSNGTKQWVQRITIRRKRCELGLGNPSLVSLAAARETALENRKLARSGGDPMRAKKEAAAMLTFEQAARTVHELHKPTWRNVKHAAQFISTLETYAFPRMGNLKVGDVEPSDVLAVLSPIWTKKPETARRVRQRIGTVMKWAVAQGWSQDNPADAIAQALPKITKVQKHRKSLPYQEVQSCLRTIKASGAGITTKLALEFLVLTASRSGEVRGALWSEFDFHGASSATTATMATWEIPAERMKAKKSHRVPISERALTLLREAEPMIDDTGLVFVGTKMGKPLSDMTLSKLVKEHGFEVDVHGFRTSFRTWTQEQTNFPREVAEAALAHKLGDAVEQAYARSDLFDKRRIMMESWANFISLSERAV